MTRRSIGPAGTLARLLVGGFMLGTVVDAELSAGFTVSEWILGLVVFPSVVGVWQWARARRTPDRLVATGLWPHLATVAVFLALWLTPDYAPGLSVTSDAALIFFGTSMLVAALRGHAGCEVLVLSNWLLRRDDQVGCMFFAPVDHLERAGRPGTVR